MLWGWESEESDHDAAVRRAKSYLAKKYGVKPSTDSSVGAGSGGRTDVWAYNEGKRIWYLCEVKDKKGDLPRGLDQLDKARHFLTHKSRKDKVICFLGITKSLFDDIRTGKTREYEDFRSRMRKQDIKIWVIFRTKVEEL